MAQIKGKFIADETITATNLAADSVTDVKVRLSNDAFLRARNNANSADIDILKVTTGDVIQFAAVPQATADASAGNDLVRKSQVDSLLQGLKPKEAVRAATTAAGTLASDFENGDAIDGVTLATGDRILIKDQAAAAENGIYTVNATGAPTRATDFDETTPTNEIEGAYVAVQEGTSHAGKTFVQTGTVTTLNTDPINFVFFNSTAALTGGDGIDVTGSTISADLKASGGLVIDTAEIAVQASDLAGDGLAGTGNTLSVNVDGSSIVTATDTLQVNDAGISTAKLAGTSVTAAKLGSDVVGNGLTGGNGSAISALANVTETSTAEASAVIVASAGLSISVDDSSLEGSGQGAAGAETLRVKDAGITEAKLSGGSVTTAKLAATSVTAAKLGSDVVGNGLTGGNGSAISAQADTTGGANLATAVNVSSNGLAVGVDGTSIQDNGSNQLEGLKGDTEEFLLVAGDITNQYVDLANPAARANSVTVHAGGVMQDRGADYTVSLTGGAGGAARITFSGDLATGGNAALVDGDFLQISYEYF
jgi:hypothetical protein